MPVRHDLHTDLQMCSGLELQKNNEKNCRIFYSVYHKSFNSNLYIKNKKKIYIGREISILICIPDKINMSTISKQQISYQL